ncbi:MAG: hypothetical protein O7D91_04400 [Planctomycetota bacterium]|nr:hypothetical protein [Planctomycetota bacterium]
MEPATSPIVILLGFAAAAAVIGAWALALRERRRFRALVTWIETHHGARWAALPGAARRFNLEGGVEHLRRQGLGEDPEFMARYRTVKRSKPLQVILQVAGVALIGTIILGVRYLGWIW